MIELHCHLGGATPSPVLWEVSQDEGIALSYKSFDELQKAMTAEPGNVESLDDFLGRFFHIAERIQSSPRAMEVSCYQAVAKAYRRTRGQLFGMELRFTPWLRTRGGELQMDHIIEAAIRGLSKVSSHYGVRTGMIFSLGRELSYEENCRIVDAAVRWIGASTCKRKGFHGVVGIDMAGPESGKREWDPDWIRDIAALYKHAMEHGLWTTYHIGETEEVGAEGMERVLEHIELDRIGHGIWAHQSESLMHNLHRRGICLEIAPTVNLVTKVIDQVRLASALETFLDFEVPFVLCTDNPYLVHTNLDAEMEWASKISHAIVGWSNENQRRHTFLRT